MISEEHSNIRTFQFFLSKISELYEMIRKFDVKGREAFLKCIIEYSFKVCVSYKNGTLEYNWKENEEYEFKRIGKASFWGNNLTYRFVDDFVIKSILDEERIKKMFEMYVDEYIIQKNDQLEAFRRVEGRWYLCTDDEVQDQIKETLEDLEENKYKIDVYVRIISLLIDLEEAGFPKENMEVAIEKMKANIEKLTYHMYLDTGYCSGSNEKKEGGLRKLYMNYKRLLIDVFKSR